MERIKLWSIQTKEAWDQLNQEGFLIGSKAFIASEYLTAYDWMKSKMIDKISLPEMKSQYPIWAWYQYHDKKKNKPDLRRSGHLPPNTKGVRIEFTKSKNEVLLSDFELWHQPLFYKGYIGQNEVESLNFEQQLNYLGLENLEFKNYPVNIKIAIVNSWDYLFDLEFNDNYFTTSLDNKMIQACFWKLRLSEISSVDHFISR